MLPAPAPEPTWFCARPDGTRQGAFVTLFPGGAIEIRGAYKDGVLEGRWERRHPGGSIAEAGDYVAGKKHGRWRQTSRAGIALGEYELAAGTGIERRWLEDGSLYSEVSLEAGIKHGPMKIFARDGSLVESARYQHGKRHGHHTVGSTRTIRVDEQFRDGTLFGERKIWRSGLLLAEEKFDRQGRHHGPYVLWRNTKVPRVKGQLVKGKRVGAWIWRDREGDKEREGTYVDGKKAGWWLEWWNDKVVFTAHYLAGKLDGEVVSWDRRGNELGKFMMADGTGVAVTFHRNRRPATKQRFHKGTAHGFYQELTSRGEVIVRGNYRAGEKHGTWKQWTPDGVLLVEQTWKRGKLDGTLKKYAGGKLSLEATYADGVASGPYTEYRNGKPAVTGQFVRDRKTGRWTHYDPDGSVVLAATYKDGRPHGVWRQLVDGVVHEGVMSEGRRTGTWTATDAVGVVRKLTYGTP